MGKKMQFTVMIEGEEWGQPVWKKNEHILVFPKVQ